jgi:hypothetical protein
MKNKDLIYLLEQLDPESEICIELTEITSNKKIQSSYSIRSTINEYNELTLNVDLEI